MAKKKKATKKAAKKPAKKIAGTVKAVHAGFAAMAAKAEKAYPGTTRVATQIADSNMRLARIST